MTTSSPTRPPRTPILGIEDLRVRYGGPADGPAALDGVSLQVCPGEALALVGESGSGKSTLAAALLGLLPRRCVATGRIVVDGVEVLGPSGPLSPGALRSLRGRVIGFVGQSPFAAFDPLFPVDAQLREAASAHGSGRDPAALSRALASAGLDLPPRTPPHQLSGGMLQRAAVAAAVLHGPPLVVADEPTSALDPDRAAHLAATLRALKAGGTALLVVTHDLELAARVADRVHVLRDGRTVEEGPADRVLRAPADPYTASLLAAWPTPIPREAVDAGA